MADLKAGTCRLCGCTDSAPCDGGCSWVDDHHTLCSSCEGRAVVLSRLFDAVAHMKAASFHLLEAEGYVLTPREERLCGITRGLSKVLGEAVRLHKLLETR